MQVKWERARRLRNSATDAERRLWCHLRGQQLAGQKFRRQYPLGDYIVDFICIPAALVIELDGGQHRDAAAYDARRTRFIEDQGYRVLRFWNDDALLRTESVVAEIFRHLGM
jgi:very-short-patch-repair endonuclease